MTTMADVPHRTAKADFPYYDGRPVPIDGSGWPFVLFGVAVAFVALTQIDVAGFTASFLKSVLFAGIPLATLFLVVGHHWTALFGPVGLTQIGQMLVMALATIVVSLVTALVVSWLLPVAPNPLAVSMEDMETGSFVLLLLPTLPQLVGEELLAILPFLAILWFVTARLGWSRRIGILLALIGSSLLFGAAHLPTYDWHWGQALGIIGMARVVLTLAYVWTKNLWVSAGAHIVNDWAGFFTVFLAGHAPIGAE